MNTRLYNIAVGVLSASVLLVSACRNSHKGDEVQIPAVSVAYPVVDSVTVYKTYPGTLQAIREVDLVARVNGYLRRQNYNSGDYVKKGTVLFTIEDRNYADEVARCRSSLATAKANLDYAEKRYVAMSEALKGDAVSRIEVEQAKSNLEDCRAAVRAGEAALRTAETQLSYCTVRAPFDGHVSDAACDVGSYVGGEGAPVKLASIYEDKEMHANFSIDDAGTLTKVQHNISSSDIDYRHIPLNFTDSLSKTYTASLDYMAPKVDTSTGTLTMQAVLDNSGMELRSGMFVSVDLPLDIIDRAVLVKDASILTDQQGKYLYTVNDSNKVVYTPVEVGPVFHDSLRVITKGINPDRAYVTKALLKVRRGVEIKPIVEK